jgi:D-xylose transport system permease protein
MKTADAPAAPAAGPPEPPPRKRLTQAFAQGELTSLRVILMLAIIWTIFQTQEDRFLSSVNLTNLLLQNTAIGLISVGVVMVLLLGEIDLSIGAVSGLAGAVMAVLTVKHGWSPALGIVAGLAVGAAIGTFNGVMVTKIGIPSFVVTLAGLLGWQGAQLWVLGNTGTVNLPDSLITDLTGTFYGEAVAWTLAIAATAGVLLSGVMRRRRRAAAGLETGGVGELLVPTLLVGVPVMAGTWVLTSDRGLPLAVVLLVGFVAIFSWVMARTRFGRYVYAIGGNIEAARRAGIRVDRIRIFVFALASMMAAAGGIMAASRLLAVNQSSGGSDVLLLAIAGPVIAGTSLFGGRGAIVSALLGALVIGSISNGMDLLALESEVKFMITGAVLLIAVTIDALARRQRQQVGRH